MTTRFVPVASTARGPAAVLGRARVRVRVRVTAESKVAVVVLVHVRIGVFFVSIACTCRRSASVLGCVCVRPRLVVFVESRLVAVKCGIRCHLVAIAGHCEGWFVLVLFDVVVGCGYRLFVYRIEHECI